MAPAPDSDSPSPAVTVTNATPPGWAILASRIRFAPLPVSVRRPRAAPKSAAAGSSQRAGNCRAWSRRATSQGSRSGQPCVCARGSLLDGGVEAGAHLGRALAQRIDQGVDQRLPGRLDDVGVHADGGPLPAAARGGHQHPGDGTVSYTHLRAHETVLDLVCRLLLEKKK